MISEFRKVLINRGFGVRVEDINAVDAFFGTLPGNGVAQVRRVIAHTRNYVDLMPISAVWAGEKTNPSTLMPPNSPPLIYAATQGGTPYRSNTVPYVVALDDVGRAVPVVPAKQVAVKDVRLQAAVVARWLTDLRTVVTDAVAQRRLVDEVYAETGQNSAASATVTEFYSKNSPFDLLTKQTVDASVESIVQQSTKTFEVTWTEVTRDLVGEYVGSRRYRAFVSVTTQEVTDARQALVNPLGLYVTNLTWGEVVSTSGSSSAVGSDQTAKGDSGK
jgi:type IV secretory pathway TrbF-like protein